MCEPLTIGRSFICLETTNVFQCLGTFATTPRDFFGRSMDTRDLAERAPGACTDLEPCWQFQGDFTRGFFESNDYLMWLLVLSLVLIVLACCIVWLFIVVLWQRHRERTSREQLVQLRTLFQNYMDTGARSGGIGEPGAVGPPDLSAYGYKGSGGGGYALPGEESEPTLPGPRPQLVASRAGRQRRDLKVAEDGSVVRTTTDDMQSVEARIASNSGWGGNNRMSGNNAADMAMQASVGNNVDEPDASGATRKPTQSSRARLVPKTYTVGFGKGLQIDSYSGDSLRQMEEEEEAQNEEPLVL